MKNRPVVLLHGINMTSYMGYEDNIHAGGFKFARERGFGGEIYNFDEVDGRCYGYVEIMPRDDTEVAILLEHLGAPKSSASLDGVLVVWTAPCRDGKGREVVGWYKNATVHRYRVEPKGKLKRKRKFRDTVTGERFNFGYRVEADAGECRLLHPDERVLRIPRFPKGTKGVPGQSSVYYPARQTSSEAKRILRRVLRFIDDGKVDSPKRRRPGKNASGRGQDQERKRKIERAAVKRVRTHFGTRKGGLGYEIASVESEGAGFDLLMTKGDVTLCVEVKGRSVDEVAAEFSRNESQTIVDHQEGGFERGDYRVCIVTDALNERGNSTIHHFSWWADRKKWIDVEGSSAELRFRPSGATVARLARTP